MTLRPTLWAQPAHDGDDSPADGIQDDHADQQECQHHHGSAALAGAVKPCEHDCGNADQQRTREEHSAGWGEPEPMSEPSPIASGPGHA